MGKTIHLTEEQIRRFFGEGFGRRLIGENNRTETPTYRNDSEIPKRYAKTLGHAYDSGDVDADGNPVVTNSDPDKDGLFFTNQDYIPREVAGNLDLPGYGGAVAKMADFGRANLTDENALDNNRLLQLIRKIYDQFEGGEMNIIDVLKIMHQIKGGLKKTKNGKLYDKSKDGGQEKDATAEITEEEAQELLNSIDIKYILSNYITVNAPDYVYWRLTNLTEDEIDNIRKTYGKDFSGFGQRCDGCGASKWKTTITPYEHDDAHINLEYMGGEAAKNTSQYAVVNEGYNTVGKMNEYLLPFQIHHMNENPGDNSPLNLACLCPNCHAITGSYGTHKGNMTSEAFNILKNNTTTKDGSLNGFMNDQEINKIAETIKKGKFESRTVANSLTGAENASISEYEYDPNNTELQNKIAKFGVQNPQKFIEGFNKMFNSIYNEGADRYNESLRTGSGVKTSSRKFELNGLDFYCKFKTTDKGNISLQIYCGKEPYIFSAFKNNAVPMAKMYYETEKNKADAIAYVRDRIFGAALNAKKEERKMMSDWINDTAGWATKKDGDLSSEALAKLSAGTEEGRKLASQLYQSKGSKENAEKTREIKRRNNQKHIFPETVLAKIISALVADYPYLDVYINDIRPMVGDDFIEYLMKERDRIGEKGKKEIRSLGKTKKLEKAKELVTDSGLF
jgi:hypothetical protein